MKRKCRHLRFSTLHQHNATHILLFQGCGLTDPSQANTEPCFNRQLSWGSTCYCYTFASKRKGPVRRALPTEPKGISKHTHKWARLFVSLLRRSVKLCFDRTLKKTFSYDTSQVSSGRYAIMPCSHADNEPSHDYMYAIVRQSAPGQERHPRE